MKNNKYGKFSQEQTVICLRESIVMSLKTVNEFWIIMIAFIPYAITIYINRSEHTGFQIVVYSMAYAASAQLFFSFLTGRTMQFSSMAVAENEHPHLRIMGFLLSIMCLAITIDAAIYGSTVFSG